MKKTQEQKVIEIMIRGKQEWWHGEDVLSNGEIHVGYKAPTRLSELGNDYPAMIETKKSPKGNRQHVYRFRFDNTAVFLPLLTVKMRKFVQDTLLESKGEYRKYMNKPEYLENGSVRLVKTLVTING